MSASLCGERSAEIHVGYSACQQNALPNTVPITLLQNSKPSTTHIKVIRRKYLGLSRHQAAPRQRLHSSVTSETSQPYIELVTISCILDKI